MFLAIALSIFSVWGATSDPLALQWIWSSPLPHGVNIFDMANTNGLTVQVGERGQIYSSLDYDLWVRCRGPGDKALRAVSFFQDRLVVVGERGIALYSTTGVSTNAASLDQITELDLGTTDWLEGLAVSSSLAVAVGDNAAIYTSHTGTNWTRVAVSFANSLSSVVYGGGTFVAVGSGGFVATSTDGKTWQKRSSGVSTDLYKVAYVNGQFYLAGASGTLRRSLTSGASWTAVQGSGASQDLYAVAGNSTSLVVAGDSEVRILEGLAWTDATTISQYPAPSWTYYSAFWDGALYCLAGRSGMLVEGFRTNTFSSTIWVTRNDPIRQWMWEVARVEGRCVAVGDFATIQTSRDGIEWELELAPSSATNAVLVGVGGSKLGMVAAGTDGTLLFSPNGITNVVVSDGSGTVTNQVSTLGVVWEAISPKPTTNDLQGVAAWSGGLVVTGGGGTVLTSADGRAWTRRMTPTTYFLSGVAAWGSGLLAVGDYGTILASPDGTSWARTESGVTNWIYRVRHLEGQWVAVGEAGLILTSQDGASWVRRASGVSAWLNDVTAVDGIFYAVGTQGTVLASTNLVDWRAIGTVTKKALYGALSFQHQLLAVGVEGVILRGQRQPVNVLRLTRQEGGRVYETPPTETSGRPQPPVSPTSGTTNFVVLSVLPGSVLDLEYAPNLTDWGGLGSSQVLENSGGVWWEHSTNLHPGSGSYRGVVP